MDSVINQITEKVNVLLEGSALFLIDIKIKPTNNVKVFIDGDEGVTVDAVSKLNKALYAQLEDSDLFPDGDFSLEVSSPGVDEPLKLYRQYKKNIGRKVEVTLEDHSILGTLKEVEEQEITIEEVLGRKKEIKTTKIPFESIRRTIVQITF